MRYNYRRKAIDTQEYGVPSITKNGYLQVWNSHTKKKEFLHRVIWEELNGPIPGDLTIDHINGNKVDNRIENLQLLTRKANLQRNQRGSVYLHPNGKWRAKLCNTHVGMFGTKCGALMASRMANL